MKYHPKGLIILGNLQDTNGSTLVDHIEERFVKDQLINITNQNIDQYDKNETTSDVWLFQPLTIDKHRGVKTFNGDERCQPKDHSTR